MFRLLQRHGMFNMNSLHNGKKWKQMPNNVDYEIINHRLFGDGQMHR